MVPPSGKGEAEQTGDEGVDGMWILKAGVGDVVDEREDENDRGIGNGAGDIANPGGAQADEHADSDGGAKECVRDLERFAISVGRVEAPKAGPHEAEAADGEPSKKTGMLLDEREKGGALFSHVGEFADAL